MRIAIKDGIRGPASIIVPLSEGPDLNRWIFNDAVYILFGRPCENVVEIETAANFVERLLGQIHNEDVVDLFDKQTAWEYHCELVRRMLNQSCMSPAGREAVEEV